MSYSDHIKKHFTKKGDGRVTGHKCLVRDLVPFMGN